METKKKTVYEDWKERLDTTLDTFKERFKLYCINIDIEEVIKINRLLDLNNMEESFKEIISRLLSNINPNEQEEIMFKSYGDIYNTLPVFVYYVKDDSLNYLENNDFQISDYVRTYYSKLNIENKLLYVERIETNGLYNPYHNSDTTVHLINHFTEDYIMEGLLKNFTSYDDSVYVNKISNNIIDLKFKYELEAMEQKKPRIFQYANKYFSFLAEITK